MYLHDPHAQCHIVDTIETDPGHFAAFILRSNNGRCAVIETSTHLAGHTILRALDDIGIARADVDLVCTTHVHLDHAGACGILIQSLPNAKLAVHSSGAKHMIDPSILNNAARSVYSDHIMDTVVGESLPVPVERVIPITDEMELSFGDRSLHFIYTPGHAYHHLCILDKLTGTLFAGDCLGSIYNVSGKEFLVLGSAPTQFDPIQWKLSLEKVVRYDIQLVALTHFGIFTEVRGLFDRVTELVEEHESIARNVPLKDIPNLIQQLYKKRAMEEQVDWDLFVEKYQFDLDISIQGLVYFRNKLDRNK
ncbi:hypothetical protein P9112_003350 [Eukaryota sp. TZLM1-RC]